MDGLKYDPNTGQIWALRNQDANSTLTIINPATGTTTALRGFDDVAFIGNLVFMNVTNPASGTDPVVVQITNLASPLLQSTILTSGATGTNLATGQQGTIPATDPDSLKSGPNGSLILSGEADQALMFINADVGDAFSSVNTSTGVVTPIFTGVSPHGMDFVVSTPEPGALGLCSIGLIF